MSSPGGVLGEGSISASSGHRNPTADTLARLERHGAQLVDEVVQYEDVYRLCYVRGPEGILIGLAEQVG